MDNKTGCSYAEVEEKTNPCKKNIGYLHKRIHIQTTINAHTQQTTAHKKPPHLQLFKLTQNPAKFLTSSLWSLQVLDKQGSCAYKRKN